VLLHIWDTAGAEKYRAFSRQYFRGAAAAIVLYDITNEGSFHNVAGWLHDIRRELPSPQLVIALAGSKCDLKGQRKVSIDEAAQFAGQEALPFFEVSAKDGTDVKLLFSEVARLLDHQRKSGERPLGASPLRLQRPPTVAVSAAGGPCAGPSNCTVS